MGMSKLSHSSNLNKCPQCGKFVDLFGEFCSEACAEPDRCPDCNGLVSNDGYIIDPKKSCFYCRAD